VTTVFALTDPAVTKILALVWPFGTVRLAGKENAAMPPDRVTTSPPNGAGPVRVAVTVAMLPLATVEGLMPIDTRLTGGGFTVSEAVVVPLYEPVTVTAVVLPTVPTEMGADVAVVCPARTVTLLGRVRIPLGLALSVTTAPPAGAGPLTVAVRVTVPPLLTVEGLTPSELRPTAAGLTLTMAAEMAPLYEPVMVTTVVLATAPTGIGADVAVVCPARTVILPGRVRIPLGLALSASVMPPVGAAIPSVTDSVTFVPLTADAGEIPSVTPRFSTAISRPPNRTYSLDGMGCDWLPVTVSVAELLATPPTDTTTLRVVPPAGTVTQILVSLQLVTAAAVPLNVTVLVLWDAPKLLPEMATSAPTGADAGDRLAIPGGGVTVKL